MFSITGSSWGEILAEEFSKIYFHKLESSITDAYKLAVCYPKANDIFTAFNLCPFPKLKVVILGQDPYHGKNQAHGLAFSVPTETKIPPSLRNIYKEIKSDIGCVEDEKGNLEHWAKGGVLLLNTTLTVEEGKPTSHQGLGWEAFTDSVIKKISDEKENVVFLLWGKHAQTKTELIDSEKHLILQTSHPSPFSAHRGFLGCKHFSQVNDYLKKHHQSEIKW